VAALQLLLNAARTANNNDGRRDHPGPLRSCTVFGVAVAGDNVNGLPLEQPAHCWRNVFVPANVRQHVANRFVVRRVGRQASIAGVVLHGNDVGGEGWRSDATSRLLKKTTAVKFVAGRKLPAVANKASSITPRILSDRQFWRPGRVHNRKRQR
jgi:hypothetical protein